MLGFSLMGLIAGIVMCIFWVRGLWRGREGGARRRLALMTAAGTLFLALLAGPTAVSAKGTSTVSRTLPHRDCTKTSPWNTESAEANHSPPECSQMCASSIEGSDYDNDTFSYLADSGEDEDRVDEATKFPVDATLDRFSQHCSLGNVLDPGTAITETRRCWNFIEAFIPGACDMSAVSGEFANGLTNGKELSKCIEEAYIWKVLTNGTVPLADLVRLVQPESGRVRDEL